MAEIDKDLAAFDVDDSAPVLQDRENRERWMSDEEDLPPAPEFVLTDPHQIPVLYADWIMTGGLHGDLANVTLGVVDYTLRAKGTDPIPVAAVAKLRFTRAFAVTLHNALGGMLGIEPSGSAPANPSKIPKNQVN